MIWDCIYPHLEQEVILMSIFCCAPYCKNESTWKCCGFDGQHDIFYVCDDHIDLFSYDWCENIIDNGEHIGD